MTAVRSSKKGWDAPGVAETLDELWSVDETGYETVHRRVLASLVRHCAQGPPTSLLEVGCATGRFYDALVAESLAESGYLGIDTSNEMLRVARRNFPQARFELGDALRLEQADGSFAVVAAFELLGHLPEIAQPIREMVRVASELVLFTVWISDGDAGRTETQSVGGNEFLYRELTPEEVADAIAEAVGDGVKDIEARVLSSNKWAYVIRKGTGGRVKRPGRVRPFRGTLSGLVNRQRERLEGETRLRLALEERAAQLVRELETRTTESGELSAELTHLQTTLDRETEVHRQRLAEKAAEIERQAALHEDEKRHLASQVEQGNARVMKLESRKRRLEKRFLSEERKVKEQRHGLTTKQRKMERMHSKIVELVGTERATSDRYVELWHKAQYLAQELHHIQGRRIVRILGRLTSRVDFRDQIDPAFQQLLDDSLLLSAPLKRFMLRPSRAAGAAKLSYRFSVDRPGLHAILVAPIFELPNLAGRLVLEIETAQGDRLRRAEVELKKIDEYKPVELRFGPIPDCETQSLVAILHLEHANSTLRCWQWVSNFPLGIGPKKVKPFFGFHFKPSQ